MRSSIVLKRDNPMVEGEISFGRFRLDLARRQLRRDEKLVRLGSRALDILCMLTSAGGKIVTKDELMERVWAGVVVEEHNIQVHISALRRAFEHIPNTQFAADPLHIDVLAPIDEARIAGGDE